MRVLKHITIVSIEDLHQNIYPAQSYKGNIEQHDEVCQNFLNALLGPIEGFEKYLVDLLEDVRKQKEPEQYPQPVEVSVGIRIDPETLQPIHGFAPTFEMLYLPEGMTLSDLVEIPDLLSLDYGALERRIMNAIKAGDIAPNQDIRDFIHSIQSLEEHLRKEMFELISKGRPVRGSL